MRTNRYGKVLPTDADDGEQRKTISEWNAMGWGLEVTDPDGFDRSDPDLWSRLFTIAEWEAGALGSRCRWSGEYLRFLQGNAKSRIA